MLEQEIPDRARIPGSSSQSTEPCIATGGCAGRNALQGKKVYHFQLNGESKTLQWCPLQVTVNGGPRQLTDLIEFGDQVEYRLISPNPG